MCVSCCDRNTTTKSNLGKKSVCSKLTIPGYSSPLWGNQGKNFKHLVPPYPQSKVEKKIDVCLLACTLLDFPTITQFRVPCLGNHAAHSRLGLPASVPLLVQPSRNSHRPTQYRPSLIKTFFSSDSRLCQVEKQANHHTIPLSLFQ